MLAIIFRSIKQFLIVYPHPRLPPLKFPFQHFYGAFETSKTIFTKHSTKLNELR